MLSDFECIGRTAWLGDGAPVVTGGNMTILSFLEVLESTCSSLGSKAKHLSVKASGNALKAQMHTQRFYQQQHWVVKNCLCPTQAVANNMEADSKQHGGCGCASSCESKMCSNQHGWFTVPSRSCCAAASEEVSVALPCCTYLCKCQAAYTLSSIHWPSYQLKL